MRLINTPEHVKPLLLLTSLFALTASFSESLSAQNWTQPAYYFDLDARLSERVEQAHLGCGNNCQGISATDGHDGNERGALEFNGGFLGVDNFDYDFRGTTSMSMWVYVPSGAPARATYLVDARKPGESNLPVLILDNANNRIRWGVTPEINSYDNAYPRDEWFHLVVVTTLLQPGSYDCYVNGSLLSPTTPAANYNFATQQGSTQFRVGISGSQTSNSSFRGRLDEFRIYTSGLGQADVNALYAARPDYLSAHYPFDQASLTDANVGFELMAPSPGNVSAADGFDGSSRTAVELNRTFLTQDPPATVGLTSMTTAMWVRPAAGNTDSTTYLLDFRAPGQTGPPVVIYDRANRRMRYLHGNGEARVAATLPEDEWTHLAFVTDEGDNTLDVYVDGIRQALQGGSAPPTMPNTVRSTQLTIGGNGSRNNSGLYLGRLDEMYIYHRALSAAEIAELAGVGGGADTEAPTKPTNLQVSNITSTGATFAWDASTDNVAVADYQYELYPSGGASGPWQSTNGATTFARNDLAAGTRYTVVVRAVDAAGNTSATEFTAFTTDSAPDTEAPTSPTGLTATPQLRGRTNWYNFAWQPASDNVGVTDYRLELYDGNTLEDTGLFGVTTQTTRPIARSFANYQVRVFAIDAAGNESAPAVLDFTSVDVEAPSEPANPVARDIAATTASVDWTAATDNGGAVTYRYKVEGGSFGSPWFSSGASTSADLSNLPPDEQLTFRLRAVDAVGNKSEEVTTQFTTLQTSSARQLTALGYEVFPNPVPGDVLTVRGGEVPIARVELTDLLGRVALAQSLTQGSVDVAGLPSGTYVLSAFAKTGELVGVTRVVR